MQLSIKKNEPKEPKLMKLQIRTWLNELTILRRKERKLQFAINYYETKLEKTRNNLKQLSELGE